MCIHVYCLFQRPRPPPEERLWTRAERWCICTMFAICLKAWQQSPSIGIHWSHSFDIPFAMLRHVELKPLHDYELAFTIHVWGGGET